MIWRFVKKVSRGVWDFVKRFPISCYGSISFAMYFILYQFSITYDYGLIALIPMFVGAPFVWVAVSIEKLIFPEYFLHSATEVEGLINFIIASLIALLISIILDLLLLSIRQGHLKKLLMAITSQIR